MKMTFTENSTPARRRRRLSCFLILMVPLALVVIAAVNHGRILREAFYTQICVSNLKQVMNGVFYVAFDEKKKTDKDAVFPMLQELIFENEAFSELTHCPKTHDAYIYVRYGRPVSHEPSDVAANTPVLFDRAINSHPFFYQKKPNILLDILGICEKAPLVLVAFEDGHVSAEKNLTCFMDLYDRFAPFMLKEDAELLREYCEKADK